MPTPETLRQLLVAYEACESKKGEDTRILSLDPADSGLADFFLITSASNDRQVVAIADEIEYTLKQAFGLYATSVEGRAQGEWVLLDYTDIVIHVFLAEKRAFYDIERLRKSARNLTGADVEAELKIALAEKTRSVRGTTKSKAANSKTGKGESTVSAKKATKKAPAKAAPVKAVAKKAAVKTAAKPAVKTAAVKQAAVKQVSAGPVKASLKKRATSQAVTPVAAKKAAKKTTKKAAVVTPTAAPLKVAAPVTKIDSADPAAQLLGRGAKPPIIKVQPPIQRPVVASVAATDETAAKG